MDGTGPDPLSDSQLERELESALGIEPSTEFLARVRTRVAAEPEMSPWRLALWARGPQPVVIMAVLSVLLAVVFPQWMSDDDMRIKPVSGTATRAIARVLEREAPSSVRAASSAPVGRRRTVRPARGTTEVPLRLSQPIFSEADQRAFVQFVVAVEEGRFAPVTEAAETDAQSATRAELRIEPLAIDPLPLLARVRKEGEGQW